MGKTYIGSASTAGVATVANQTDYWPLGGVMKRSTTENNRNVLFRLPGILSNLYIRVLTNTIAATSTFRTRNNNANGGQSVSIGSTATGEFTDTTGTDTVAAGDKLNYQFVPGAATNTTVFVIHSCIFAATTDTVTRTIAGNDTGQTTASTTWFFALCGDTGANVTTETNAKQRMRKSFTLKNACARVVNARAQTTTVRSRKNGANGNLSISCTGGASGYYEDTSNSDTISAGEDWNWSVTTGTGTDQLDMLYVAADLLSTNGDGLVGISHMTTVAITDATTRYSKISGGFNVTATEADTKADCRIAGDYSELTCLVTQNGVSIASTVTLRKNGADTTLIASITASTTGVFSDSIHTETLVATDEVNYEITVPSVAGTQTVSICNIVMNTHVTTSNSYTVTLTTETVSVSDSLARLYGANRPLSTETVASNGGSLAIRQTLNRPLITETVASTDSVARVRGVIRLLATETVNTSEAIARMLAATRTLPETTTLSESIARMTTANRALSTETVSVSDSIVRIKGVVRALATETIAIGESLARMLAANRLLSTETVVVSDSITRLVGKIRALIENTVISDSINRVYGAVRPLSDTTIISDSIARVVGFVRVLATQTVSTSESIARQLAATRTLIQTTAISDALDYVFSGINHYTKTLIENIAISDSIARMLAAKRTLSETTAITDSLERVKGLVRTLIETVSLSESLSRLVGLTRVLIETISLSDLLARRTTSTRSLSETTAVSETINRLVAASRALSDSVVISESLTKVRTVVRLLTETVNINESLNRVFIGTRQVIQTVDITDTLTHFKTFFQVPTILKKVRDWFADKYSINAPPKE